MRILATRSALTLSFFVIATALLLASRVAGQIGYGAPRAPARADTTAIPIKPVAPHGPFGTDSLPPPTTPVPGVEGSPSDSALAYPYVTPLGPGSKTADEVGPPPPLPPPEEAHLVGPVAVVPAAEADAQGRGRFTLWRWVAEGSSRSRRTRLGGGELGGFGGGQVPANFMLKVGNPRVVREIDVDLEGGNIRRSTRLDDLTFEEAPPQNLRDFAHERIFAGRWRDYTRESRTLLGRQVTPGGEFLGEGRGFTLAAPTGMLGPAERIVGPGASITIRGSERISISGTSNWDAHLRETGGRKQSKFPQLDLRQDLNINVDGKVGDKVSIDWTENSNQETPLANRIAIRYAGYEEEVVKAVELGNTNLSLPGTQFVSYNGQHQGLFGIKTQSQFGSLGLTVIASKQEGQTASNRFVGYAQETQRQIFDLDYVQRRFFFLVDPVDPLLRGTFLPPENPAWVLPPRISDLQVWRDDRVQTNNGQAVPGLAFVGHRFNPQSVAPDTAVTAHFDLLRDQEDYVVRRNFFTIRDAQNEEHSYAVIDVQSPIGQDDILAATFTATYQINGRDSVVTYGVARDDSVLAKALFFPQGLIDLRDGEFVSRNHILYPVRRLELRNIYSLGATDVDLATLKLSVKLFGADDPLHFPGAAADATFLRGLGADKRVNQTSTEGFDEQIDRELLKPDLGLVILPDLRPFAPAAEDSVWPFFRADLPAGRPAFFVEEHANRAVYDHPSPDRGIHRKYFFEVSFATPQTQFVLSAPGTILEGSETVVVDGTPLARGTGYTIDYETGIVNLTGTTPLPQNAQIAIDYAYAPLFALGQKTLMGFHAGWDPGAGTAGRRFGTTWLFESSGVSERRPKLGEEPARTVVGDLNGGFQAKPFFMNQLVEALPGVRASADSRLELTAEVGLSLPNPNTRGEVYVEDFEGAKENSILSLQREDWFWSSIPDSILQEPSPETRRGQLIWYNPVISPVFERDLFPELLQREEGNDRRSVLTLNVDPRRADSAGFDPTTWVGLTQAISGSGADFTRKQYIEIWVNDFGDGTFLAAHPRMIIDLGTIDEDAQWHPTLPPNDRHDTEDNKSIDGILDRSDALFEDTGLDSLQSVDEPGYADPGNPDPHGDDFPPFDREEAEEHPSDPKPLFAGINRFENNQHLEDEDLNHDKFLNRNNSYFEYSIDLADSVFVAADVCQEDGRCGPQERDTRPGRLTRWRLYRIPIEAGRQVNNPSLGSVRHFRIWFTGFPEERLIQIAGIDILGNLFKVEPLRDPKGNAISSAPGEVVSIRGINNKENAEYQPPFPLLTQNGIVEREQSLAFDFQSLGSGHEGSAFRALPSDRDFTLYETIKWWIYGKGETQGVEAFVRFGADTLNYYEYAVPVRAGWSEEEIPLTELSGLKLESTAGDSCKVSGTQLPCFSRRRDDGRLLSFVGRPSFTRLRRVTFGVRNAGAGAPSGSVWFDDLRLDQVFRDRGQATRVELKTQFADLLTLSTDIHTRDEDFLSIGSGGQRTVNRGLGSRQRDLGLQSTMNLNKFFETSGIKLPVAFSYSRNRELPEFRSGDDIVLTGADSRIQERGSVRRSYSANWSRVGAQSGLLRYTLDGFAADFNLSDQRSLSQTRQDSTRTINLGLSYRVNPGLKPVLFGKTELRYFPDQISLSLRGVSGRTFSYNRDLENPARRELVSAVYTKNAALNGTTSMGILRSLRAGYNILSNRDLTADNPAGWLGGLNIGSEITRNQGLDLTWNPNPSFLRQMAPNLSYRGSSHDDHSRNLRVPGDREQVRNIGATQNLNGTFNVPITLLTGQGPSAPAPGDSTRPLRRFQNQFGRVGRLRDLRVNLAATNSRDFGYATGVPRWLYQLGLSTHPGEDIRLTGRGVENRGLSRSATFGSGFDLQFGVAIGTSYVWRTTRNEVTLNTPRASRTVTWPQLELDWRTVHTRIPQLGKAFKTVNLESRYTRDLSESGPVGNASQNVNERRDWNPLVGMNGTLTSGWSLRARVNSTGSEDRANEGNLGGFTNSTRRQYQVDLSRRFDPSTGLKFPWQKKPIKLKSDLSLNTNVSYSTDRSESGRRGQAPVVSRDGSTMSIRSGVSYNFRRNIDGEFSVNFGRNNDKKQDRALRSISLSGSLVFNF